MLIPEPSLHGLIAKSSRAIKIRREALRKKENIAYSHSQVGTRGNEYWNESFSFFSSIEVCSFPKKLMEWMEFH